MLNQKEVWNDWRTRCIDDHIHRILLLDHCSTNVFDRNANGWVTIPKKIKLPNNQQDRDMIARELLVKFQMSPKHPLVDLKKAYLKF